MSQAFVFSVDVIVFGALLVLVVLYSRIVYALWFKPNDVHQVNHQQIVGVVWIFLNMLKSLLYTGGGGGGGGLEYKKGGCARRLA